MTFTRLAYEEVTIAHGGMTVTLRPSLRAAAILEARFGFPAMFRALDECNLTIISEIITTAVSHGPDAAAFLAGNLGRPLSPFFEAVQAPLFQLVSMFSLAPVHRLDAKANTASAGKAIPWPDFYRQLYRTATGKLNWTPEAAWNATPTEIDQAVIGMFGSGEKRADPEQAAQNVAAGLDPEFDRAGLAALKAKLGGAR